MNLLADHLVVQLEAILLDACRDPEYRDLFLGTLCASRECAGIDLRPINPGSTGGSTHKAVTMPCSSFPCPPGRPVVRQGALAAPGGES